MTLFSNMLSRLVLRRRFSLKHADNRKVNAGSKGRCVGEAGAGQVGLCKPRGNPLALSLWKGDWINYVVYPSSSVYSRLQRGRRF